MLDLCIFLWLESNETSTEHGVPGDDASSSAAAVTGIVIGCAAVVIVAVVAVGVLVSKRYVCLLCSLQYVVFTCCILHNISSELYESAFLLLGRCDPSRFKEARGHLFLIYYYTFVDDRKSNGHIYWYSWAVCELRTCSRSLHNNHLENIQTLVVHVTTWVLY